jgi:hypothetical protein
MAWQSLTDGRAAAMSAPAKAETLPVTTLKTNSAMSGLRPNVENAARMI